MVVRPHEAQILRVLLRYRSFKTTAEIAKNARMSWSTTDSYLHDMYYKGWVIRKGERRYYWKVRLRRRQ